MANIKMKRDIDQFRLDQMYNENYYWYLDHPEFHRAFLQPIAARTERYGGWVMDVGCGLGQLATNLNHDSYLGIDGSMEAVRKAAERHPLKLWVCSRIEEFPQNVVSPTLFDTIVFGGVIWCLIEPESYLDFVGSYTVFRPKQFIIYDLTRLSIRPFLQEYKHVGGWEDRVVVAGLEEAKCHRRVEIFQCH